MGTGYKCFIYSQTTLIWLELRTTFISHENLKFHKKKVRVFRIVRNFFMDGVSVGKYLGEHSILFSLGEMIGSVPVRIRENGI